MLFDPVHEKELRPWLKRTLEPICDAEPEVLAKYVLALLAHDLPEPELRKLIVSQLDAFLGPESATFVDILFATLRSKSYLPYQTNDSYPSRRSASPDPRHGTFHRSRKRSLEQDDRDRESDRESRLPPKGPRLSTEQRDRHSAGVGDGYTPPTGRHGRWPNDHPDRVHADGWRGSGGPVMNGSSNMTGTSVNGAGHGRGGQNGNMRGAPLKRGMCRDYHNLGFCSRGATCNYSHGEDAVVPSMPFVPSGGQMPPGMPFHPGMMGPGGFQMNGWAGEPPGGYNPNESKMDIMGPVLVTPSGAVHHHNRAPPTTVRTDNRALPETRGELPVIQDLTPDARAQPHPVSHEAQMKQQPNLVSISSEPQPGYAMQVPMHLDEHQPPSRRGGSRGGRGQFGGRGGRGTFREPHGGFNASNSSTTLVIEKIPQEQLSLPAISTYFSRFGTVTNVAISTADSKALVSFASHEEAHKAWKSEEAIFGNRFVKVYWHRPMEGQGGQGEKALKDSAETVRKFTGNPSLVNTAIHQPNPTLVQNRTASSSKPAASSSVSTTAQVLKEHQQQLERQISEQKSLMGRLSGASSVEKKEIMVRLRQLGEEMKNTPAPGSSPAQTSSLVDTEANLRAKLDQELDIRTSNPEEPVSAGPDAEGSALAAKLAKLRAEAASLGINTDEASAPSTSSYYPYRGRGRGAPRGYFRGSFRGGARGSMKLDNRPRKLLVKGVTSADEGTMNSITTWYQGIGNVDSIEKANDGILVSFRDRVSAELALSRGSSIPDVGSVQLSWHATPLAPNPAPMPSAHSSIEDDTREEFVLDQPTPEDRLRGHSHDVDDEGGGWGQVADDEDDDDTHRRRRR